MFVKMYADQFLTIIQEKYVEGSPNTVAVYLTSDSLGFWDYLAVYFWLKII